MRTLDERYTPKAGRLAGWRRDMRLLIRIARMVFTYAVAGRHIRRAYRRAEARNEIYWLDEELS